MIYEQFIEDENLNKLHVTSYLNCSENQVLNLFAKQSAVNYYLAVLIYLCLFNIMRIFLLQQTKEFNSNIRHYVNLKVAIRQDETPSEKKTMTGLEVVSRHPRRMDIQVREE